MVLKKMEIVAQSYVEVEYVAIATMSNQAIWLRKILEDLDMKQIATMNLKLNNNSTIAITANLM